MDVFLLQNKSKEIVFIPCYFDVVLHVCLLFLATTLVCRCFMIVLNINICKRKISLLVDLNGKMKLLVLIDLVTLNLFWLLIVT